MGSNFTDFGDLVLLIGDFHVPQRAIDMPTCFRELLNTDKIRHVLCTGNVGSKAVYDTLKSIANSVHIVKGDMDQSFDFPEYKVVQIGEFRVGLIHGHQIIPWGENDAMSQWQRRLDCDILVSGHTHKNSVTDIGGKFFINPGSATGAFQPWEPSAIPSFMLMAVQGPSVVLYVYEERDGKASVVMSEFRKPGQEVSNLKPNAPNTSASACSSTSNSTAASTTSNSAERTPCNSDTPTNSSSPPKDSSACPTETETS